ncbi:unnamed protein product, partial [Mesorhabditis spiculigera]
MSPAANDPESKLTCQDCNRSLRAQPTETRQILCLVSHCRTHVNKKTLECSACGFAAGTQEIEQHIQDLHDGKAEMINFRDANYKEQLAAECAKNFPHFADKLREHVSKASEKNEESFESKPEEEDEVDEKPDWKCFTSPAASKQGRNRYPCKSCAKILNIENPNRVGVMIVQHCATHSRQKPYECSECTFTARTRTYVLQHIRQDHNGRGHELVKFPPNYLEELEKQCLDNFTADPDRVRAAIGRLRRWYLSHRESNNENTTPPAKRARLSDFYAASDFCTPDFSIPTEMPMFPTPQMTPADPVPSLTIASQPAPVSDVPQYNPENVKQESNVASMPTTLAAELSVPQPLTVAKPVPMPMPIVQMQVQNPAPIPTIDNSQLLAQIAEQAATIEMLKQRIKALEEEATTKAKQQAMLYSHIGELSAQAHYMKSELAEIKKEVP